MVVSKELRALLRLAPRAHPELHAMLVDLLQYKPKLLVEATPKVPDILQLESANPIDPLADDLLRDMQTAETALRQPINLPPRSRFVKGKAVHVQFDGGCEDGHGTGGFVILDGDGSEVVRAGRYYGPGHTNNEAESFALRDAMQCLRDLCKTRADLRLPVRVFGDSQLLIRFMTNIYKRPQRHTIYWALVDVRAVEAALGRSVAYRHVTREANMVADDMCRRTLEAKGKLAYWGGSRPVDAPPNQLQDVYAQQGEQPQLNWADLPTPVEWQAMAPVASVTGLQAGELGYDCADSAVLEHLRVALKWDDIERDVATCISYLLDGWELIAYKCRPCRGREMSRYEMDWTLFGCGWCYKLEPSWYTRCASHVLASYQPIVHEGHLYLGMLPPRSESGEAAKPTVGVVFGDRMASEVRQQALQAARDAALKRLGEVADVKLGGSCLATAATGSISPLGVAGKLLRQHLASEPAVVLPVGMQPSVQDERPCTWCGDAGQQATMVLCDRCNHCYHPDCARASGGSQLHDGPWFCEACKGYLTLWGPPDVTQDWPLMDHLWTGWLPEDPEEADRLQRLAQTYRAKGDELQVLLPEAGTRGERWVDVPPLISRAQLLSDLHASLGHCGRDKLLASVKDFYWWPGVHSDVADCVKRCHVCQRDKPPPKPREELRFVDKGSAPFIGWSVDVAGPFPTDDDGNRFLAVAVDPFSKWVEARPIRSNASWRLAEFLYDDLIVRWGKPRYVRTDNGAEFAGSFERLCQAYGIVHHRITVGNSKANGQVERVIRTLKDSIRRGLTAESDTFWSNHLGPALALLRLTPHTATRISPFELATGRQPLLPSIAVPDMPELPPEPSPEQEDTYLEAFAHRVEWLQKVAGDRLREVERAIRARTRAKEDEALHPTALFFFEPGQMVLRRNRPFSKLDARAQGPFRVKKVLGLYRQRIVIEPFEQPGKRTVTVHASQLVPFNEPYVEPQAIDIAVDDEPTATPPKQPRVRQKRARN